MIPFSMRRRKQKKIDFRLVMKPFTWSNETIKNNLSSGNGKCHLRTSSISQISKGKMFECLSGLFYLSLSLIFISTLIAGTISRINVFSGLDDRITVIIRDQRKSKRLIFLWIFKVVFKDFCFNQKRSQWWCELFVYKSPWRMIHVFQIQ